MNGDSLKRISQEGQRQNEAEGGILESASAFAQRVLEEIEALAGTTACKPVQLVRLKQWAQEQGCWFDDNRLFGDFFNRGSKNEVILSCETQCKEKRSLKSLICKKRCPNRWMVLQLVQKQYHKHHGLAFAFERGVVSTFQISTEEKIINIAGARVVDDHVVVNTFQISIEAIS